MTYSKVSFEQDDGTTKKMSFTPDNANKDVLRVIDAAPFAYDETNLAKRITKADIDKTNTAIDNIITTIGAENIALFLPLWEASGTTVYDLLKRDLTFSASATGVTLGQDTPFGAGIQVNGTSGYLVRDSLTQNTTGTTDYALNGATLKAATRPIVITGSIGFIRLKLKRTGTLNTATIRASIYSDSSTAPNAAIANGTSTALACSSIGTSYELRGFSFATAPTLQKNTRYWIVLEYVDTTAVDSNNYISWQYETGANTYGEARSTYDGATWTTTAGENHVFGIWNDALALSVDYSIIALATNTAAITNTKDIYCQRGMINISALLRNDSTGRMALGAYDSTSRFAYGYDPSSTNFNVFAGTFSKTKDTGKLNLYKNGILSATANGTASTASELGAQPVIIGASISAAGAISSYWQGIIGAIILTKSELSAANVAIVSHNLLALRKYGLAL